MRGAHNAATNVGESLLSLIGYHHIQQIEIDLHANGSATTPGSVDWRVYHATMGAHCTPLRKCLTLLRAFHDNNPAHEPVIVFLDSADAAFGPNFPNTGSVWTPIELDNAIRSIGDDVLYKASDFLRKSDGTYYSSLGAAARAGVWPKVADLRGKFIFGLTGNFVPNHYMTNCGAYCGSNVAFEALVIPGGQTVSQVMSEMDGSGAAMFNFKADWSYNDTVSYAWVQGYVTRGYGDCALGCGLNSGQYQNSYLSHMHIMALDDPNMSLIWNTGFYVADKGTASSPAGLGSESFAYTDTLATGGKVVENTRVRSVEGDFITLVSQSATWDAGSTTDNLMFANQSFAGSGTNTWKAFISGRSGAGEDPNAKGCIMARASLSADAPFVAVCKRSNQTISALVRTTTGGAVTSTNIVRPDIDGCDANSGPSAVAMDTLSCLDLHFVELQAYNNNTCVKVFGSSTGTSSAGYWTQIVDQCVSSPLVYQGILSASHNINGSGTFVFSGLNLNGVTQTLGSLPTLTKMGSINTTTSVAYDYLWNRESIGGDATPANPYFCGDTLCRGGETAVTCAADCKAAVPSGVSGSYSSGLANLAWAASMGATSYRVKRGAASGGPYMQIANPSTASYGDPGIAGTNYYVVSSINR
jgi:hypothetical protein